MAIDWNVKNAVNRDVERQHLNKILADIRASVDALNKTTSKPASDIESAVGKMVENNTESGINVTYNAAKKVLDFVITDFTITLTGDVTGSGTVSRLGDVSISTSVDDSIGIEEAPTDGLPYWRVAGDWAYVGVALESLANMSGTGFTVIRSNDSWITREFEVVAGELVVTNADGNDGNPTFGLADVVDSNTGTLQGITVDGKGRVTGTTDATITAGAGIDVVNGDAAAGPPTISHEDTSSVANLNSDNSNGVVLQDIALTFDTFGHVQTISVGTVDLDTRYAPAAILASTITDGDTTHAPDGNAVFDALDLKFDKAGGTVSGGTVFRGVLSCESSDGAIQFGGFGGSGTALMTFYGEGKPVEIRPTSRTNNAGAIRIDTTSIHCRQDNASSNGLASLRWSVIYAATGTINTSDARDKSIRGPLNEAEIAAALDMASAAVIYQWNEAIAEKGEAARLHCSPTVQSVIAILQSHGLDPFRYGFVCYDQWEAWTEPAEYEPVIGEDGEPTGEQVLVRAETHHPAGDRYSLRPTELQAFVSAGLAAKLATL